MFICRRYLTRGDIEERLRESIYNEGLPAIEGKTLIFEWNEEEGSVWISVDLEE